MITEKQISNLVAGCKLIFYRDGGVLSAQTGYVFTFSNWHKEDDELMPGKRWWQCKELHDTGNHKHNFSIFDVEIFDPDLHNEYIFMGGEKLIAEQQEFIKKYGD